MPLWLFILLLSCFCTVKAEWTQDEFVIASWGDPSFTCDSTTDLAMLQTFKDAGFNTLSGCPGSYIATHAFARGNSWFAYFSERGYGIAPNQCASYRLNLLASTGGIKTFLNDENILMEYKKRPAKWVAGSIPNVAAMINNGSGINPDNFTADQKKCLLGYLLPDEANCEDNNNNEPGISRRVSNFILPVQNAIKTKYPDLVCLANFGVAAEGNLTTISNNFTSLMAAPSTRIIAYDYYVFEDLAGGMNRNGYFTLGASKNGTPAVLYFATLDLLAKKVKGTKVVLWASGGNVEHTCYNKTDRKVNRHHVNLSEAQLAYASYSRLLYGTRGLYYYGYDFGEKSYHDDAKRKLSETHANSPFSASWNRAGYYSPKAFTTLKKINNRIKTMGPTIMGLTWQKTVHGTAVDPNSTESGLETTFTNTPFNGITQPFSGSKTGAIAVGVFKDAKNTDVFMIMNKDIRLDTARTWVEMPNTTTYTVDDLFYPVQLDKDNGSWTLLPRVIEQTQPLQTTKFTLTLAAGDMQLVRLAPGDILPLVDLSINKIGVPASTIVDGNSDASIITVTGSGSMGVLAGKADNIYFENKSGINNFSASARILQGTTAAQYSGIMVRKSLGTTSAMMYLCYDKAAGRIRVCYRNADNGKVVYATPVLTSSAPNTYLRLKRYGNTVKAYGSIDGTTYPLLASVTFPTGAVHVGLVQTGTNVTTRVANWTLTE